MKSNTKHAKAVVLNDLLPLSISYLKKAFNLQWAGKRTRSLNLNSVNPLTGKTEVQASILVTLYIDIHGNDYIELNYDIDYKPKTQKIELVAKKSSIGKGNWYSFICPITGISCRKLFFYKNQFVSKQAIQNPHYKSQLQSRKQRNAMKDIKKLVQLQDIVSTAEKKYFKKFYAGEPTKKHIRVLMAADDLKGLW